MINEKYHGPDARGLQLALPVPTGTKAGIPTMVGSLLVVPQADQVTAQTIGTNAAAKSTKVGWAPCFIPGTGQLLDLGKLPDGTLPGTKIYLDDQQNPVVTETPLFVGWAVPAPGFNGGLFVAIRANQ